MFDIYAALKSGKSADEIAQAFVDELNAGIQKVEAEQKAEKEAEAAKAKDASAVADHFNTFIKVYYPTVPLKFTDRDIVQLVEAAVLADEATAKINESTSVEDAVDVWAETLDKFFTKYGI